MASQNSSDLHHCLFSTKGLYVMLSYTVVWTVLLFPIYALILYISVQRRRQNNRYTISHTDFFTYHSFFFELLVYIGYIFVVYGTFKSQIYSISCGYGIMTFATVGVISPHILTCIERYLAVVHPVVYMKLKTQLWIRARNVIILVIWLISPLWLILMRYIPPQNKFIPVLILLVTGISVITFCSFQVLRTLRNPGPGEGQQVGKSKQRAMYTILTIQFVLMLWLTGGILCTALQIMYPSQADLLCVFIKSVCWAQFPSALVLPLLFLHRAGKMPC